MKINNRTSNLCFTFLLGALISQFGHAQAEQPPLMVVDYVDLNRYLGNWYEIASIPKRFQKGCVDSRAEYSMMSRNKIKVTNTCEVNGRTKIAEGKAWVVDHKTNAKLKVQFFWPFRGDYWIIDLGEEYEYAVVGNPDRDSLWILSRTPQISDELYNDLIDRIEFIHLYNVSAIVRSPKNSEKTN